MNQFEQCLGRYAKLIVSHGLNVQPGQLVNIATEPVHKDFVLLVASECYRAGAKYVDIVYSDPRAQRLRVEEAEIETLEFVPEYFSPKIDYIVDNNCANLKLIGSEFPEALSGVDPNALNRAQMALRKASKYLIEDGIGKSKIHWTVAAAATPGWAKRVHPELSSEAALEKLWQEIFSICRVDTDDFLERWKQHNDLLQSRAKLFTEMKIKTLHFTGPGTDLKVGLSPKAIFKGGGENGPLGVEFEPNLPTEEIFTTPDWRQTEGVVRATRPFLVNGKLIENLEMTFAAGRVENFRASSGSETFGAYINSDEGASRLGEVALVDISSPVYQSGSVFEEILFDENAACHIAVGMAYKFCVDGGTSMSKEELEEIGCNASMVHTDIMISSEEVDVFAETHDGKKHKIIENGLWLSAG